MRKSRFPQEQIIGILREQEAGMATAEVYRRHGISSDTWKWNYGGLEVSEAKRESSLRELYRRLLRLRCDSNTGPTSINI